MRPTRGKILATALGAALELALAAGPAGAASREVPAPCASDGNVAEGFVYQSCRSLFSLDENATSDFQGTGFVARTNPKPLVFPGGSSAGGPTQKPGTITDTGGVTGAGAASPTPGAVLPAPITSPFAVPLATPSVSLGATDVTVALRIHRRIEQKIDLLYGMGVSIDEATGQAKPITEGGIYSVETQKKLADLNTVCDPADPVLGEDLGRPFIPQAELGANRKGESCGRSADAWIDEATGIAHLVHVADTTGTLERSYFDGARVQAYACFYRKIMRQLVDDANQGKRPRLTVNPGCQARADLFFGDSSDSNPTGALAACDRETNAPLDRCYEALATGAKIATCPRSDGEGIAFDPTFSDPGQRKLACHHARSVRSGLESGFAAVAACEIEKRAERSYRASLGTRALRNQMLKDVGKEVYPTCVAQCITLLGYDAVPYTPAVIASVDKVAAAQCATDCWNAVGIPRLAARIQALWPSTGECAEAP